MMYCQNCGHKLTKNADFCSNCGQSKNGVIEQPKSSKKPLITGICIGAGSVLAINIIIILLLVFIMLIPDEIVFGEHEVGWDNIKVSYNVPYNYHLNEEESSEDSKKYEELVSGDYVTYTIDLAYDKYYDIDKYINEQYYYHSFQNVSMGEYTASINHKSTPVYYIDYSDADEQYRDTFAFYPIDNKHVLTIVLSINDVDINNINDYISIEKIERIR